MLQLHTAKVSKSKTVPPKVKEKVPTPPSKPGAPPKRFQLKTKLQQIKETAGANNPQFIISTAGKKIPVKNRANAIPKSTLSVSNANNTPITDGAAKRPPVEIIDESSDEDIFVSPPSKKKKLRHHLFQNPPTLLSARYVHIYIYIYIYI